MADPGREELETGLANPEFRTITKEIPESQRKLPGVYLGKLSHGFRDSYPQPIEDLGFVFTVDQTSYGRTGISASPLEGFSVEVPVLDEKTQRPKWEGPNPILGKVSVVSDRGKMSMLPPSSRMWELTLGHEGIRSGLIRVTNNRTGKVRYFALGAKFEGKEDSWMVQRGVIEVELQQELPSSGSRTFSASQDQ